jgi:hypothetical protein
MSFARSATNWWANFASPNAHSVREFYDLDGKYDFLKPRDVITLKADKGNSPTYLQITNVRSVAVKDFLKGPDKEFRKHELEVGLVKICQTQISSRYLSLYERTTGRQSAPVKQYLTDFLLSYCAIALGIKLGHRR